MALINCLRKVLDNTVLESERSCNGAQAIELKDRQSGMAVKITGIFDPVLAIRMRNHLSYLLEQRGKWTRICDYLLIYQSNVRHDAILIELKSSLTKANSGKEQLRRSLSILDYLLSICKIECEIRQQTPSIKYVLIVKQGSGKLDKQPIKIKPPRGTDEAYEKITVRTLIGTEFDISTLTQ